MLFDRSLLIDPPPFIMTAVLNPVGPPCTPNYLTSFAADILRHEGEMRGREAAPRRFGARVRGSAPRLRQPGVGGHETE